MRVWRLTRPEHAPGLDGEGARLWGGRWNSPGILMVYTASSLALAVLEVLVHLPPAMRRSGGLPAMLAVALDVPDADISDAVVGPDDRATGDAWAQRGSLALRVPSRVIRHEMNVLINPRHPHMGLVSVALSEPFKLDDRLGP
ncbi:MAG: RES family NAD+ phosphorylase [Pseudorhodobacter sp.]|nr:RES family NAD+ phosphorylase [Pseudorhodobacter sp.]